MKPFRVGEQLLISMLLAIIVASSTGAAALSVQTPPASAKTHPTRPDTTSAPAWYNPYPNYGDIKMVSANSGWIVSADNGNPRIKRYYNGTWVDYPVVLTNTGMLNAVDATTSEAWAVGQFGTILHWSGADWQRVSSPAPVTTTLVAVSIVAPGEAWAVGNLTTYQPPVILHYHVGSWSLVATPVISSDFELKSMSWTSPTDGWAVGATFDSNGNNYQPLALHYTNGSWINVPLPHIQVGGSATSIYMLNANEGWMGWSWNADSTSYSLLHYTGGIWQPVSAGGVVTTESTAAVISFAPGDYYRSYLDVQGHYFGHNQNHISTINLLTHLSGVAADDIWGIGYDGVIYHWDGVQLTPIEGGVNGNRIQMLNSNEGWMQVGGGLYGGQLYHDTAGYWAPTGTIANTFAFDRPDDGWAQAPIFGTTAGFIHYDGTGWSQPQSVADGYFMRAMQMMSSTSGWAVGSYYADPNGNIAAPAVAEFSTGSWNAYSLTIGTNAEFLAVNFSSPTDGWAVGYQGNINLPTPLVYHYSNGIWQYITPPPNLSIDLFSVSALAANDVWIVGNNPFHDLSPSYILHWDGSSWAVQQTSVQGLDAIQMLSATEGWVVGYRYFLHYVSGNWEQITVPGEDSRSLSFISPSEGWAAGVNGPWRYAARCLDAYGDVPSGYWASAAILYLSCNGIVSGTQPYTFSPNASASRIQFAKMITLAQGWPIISPTTQSFTDVPPSNPLYPFVETAHAHGAINGVDAAGCQAAGATYPCFLPNAPISRAQVAIITMQAFGWTVDTSGGPHFSDVPTNNYAYAAVETCYHHGVVSGIGGGLFAPNANVTRAQIAAILYRALTNP